MTATLALAGVLAVLSITCLGLVEAGREIDDTLARFEREAAALHRATGDTVEHGASADGIARPSTSLKRMIDALGSNAERIVRDAAPPYAQGLSRSLGASIDLVPTSDAIDRAFGRYLDQTKQAQVAAKRNRNGAELSARLLNLNYQMLVQKISEARERTRKGVDRALNGLQLITFVSIGLAALAVGLGGRR